MTYFFTHLLTTKTQIPVTNAPAIKYKKTQTGATTPIIITAVPRAGHVGEWLCLSLEIGLEGMLLAQGSEQPPHGGAYREAPKSVKP